MIKNCFPAVIIVGLLGILIAAGCGTLDVNPETREGVPQARSGSPGEGRDLDLEWEDGGEDWQDLDSTMLTEDGEAAQREQRWDVVVYFAFDRSYIGSSQRSKVEKVAEFLENNSQYSVLIEGHCDERGSDEYNRALGERRALSVKDYLVSLGVDEDRIETVSYGEEKPVVSDAATAEEHARNRRGEFIFKADR